MKNSWFSHHAALCMVVVLVIVGMASSPVSGWMFRADPTHSGVYDDGGIRPNGELRWNFTMGDRVRSSPTVANGVVYVGSADNKVYAINATTGTKIWDYTTGHFVESSPAVTNGVVYVGSVDKKVYAINATTGTKIWDYTTGESVTSNPAVANGVVYVGSDDKKVYAINATTGTKIWDYTTGSAVRSSPAVANGVVYVGSDDNKVYAINATTGTKIWDYTTGRGVDSSLAVANGVVYVGSEDNKVYAINATTGTKIWDYTTGSWVGSSPAVANGVVYVGSEDNKIYAINATTGTKIWNYTTGHFVGSSPAVANGVVYIGSFDNKVYAINATTGTKIWDYTTGKGVVSSPAVANGVVYVGSYDNKVYAIGTADLPPTITSVSPASGINTGNQNVIITGINFQTGAVVNLTNGSISIPGTTNTINYTTIRCTFPLTGAPPWGYNLNVRNPDGQTATLPKAFTVTNATPAISTITPSSGFNTSSLQVTITGTAFRNGATVSLMNNTTSIPGTITNRTTTRILATFPLTGITPGTYNLTILNSDGTSATKQDAFTVNSPGDYPAITTFTPASGINTAALPMTITGTNFRSTPTITITNNTTSRTVTGTVTGNTTIKCSLPLTGLPIGQYNLTVRNTDGSSVIRENEFNVTNPKPSISTVSPSSGYANGPVTVTISGSKFVSGAGISLENSTSSVPGVVTSFSATRITGTFALNTLSSGTYNLTVTNPGGPNNTKPFTVFSPGSDPTISSVNPTSGVNTATLPITITGTNFRPNPTVTITNTTTSRTVTGTVTGNTTIRCSLPLTGLPIGQYNLTVRNTDGSSVARENEFNVTNPVPSISTVSPSSGYTSGPATVTISGSKFVSGAGISLENASSGLPGVVTSFSATKIIGTFALGSLSSGTYNLTVINPGGPNATKPFTVLAPSSDPTITRFTPATGVNTAALPITVTGTNFRPNPTVTITNNTTSRTVTGTVTGNTTIRCSLPLIGIPFGLYNLTVRNTDGSSETRENEFVVTNPAPVISTIAPSSGYTSGAATVTISGSRFVSGAEISLENVTSGLPGVVTLFSATRITGTFLLSTLSPGTYNLTVTNPGGPNATKPFTVLAPSSGPTISGFAPTSGVNTAALPITITGTNFRPTPSVIITNNTTIRSVTGTVTGNTTIKCSLPLTGLPFGLYNLTVRNTDGSSVTRENEFTVTNPVPLISTVTPTSGYQTGPVIVTISGSKFVSGAGISLENATSGLPGIVTSFSATRITGTFALQMLSNGTYNLTVSNPGDANGTKVNAFTVLAHGTAPVISMINPASGFNNANLPVTITGLNFRTPGVYLNQGSLLKQAPATAGKTQTATTLYVTLPLAGVPGGLYTITVRNSDGMVVNATDIFYVTDTAWISKTPQTGGRSPVVQFQRNPTGSQSRSPLAVGPSNRHIIGR